MLQAGWEQSAGVESVHSDAAIPAGSVCVIGQAHTLLTDLCFGF